MYTGALENHPKLIEKLSVSRPLWGNSAEIVRAVRNPWKVADVLAASGIPSPIVHRPGEVLPSGKRWLQKPLASGGGSGIRWTDDQNRDSAGCFIQEYIDGISVAAIFVAKDRITEFLGATQQLVGESWLHAKTFAYCGSIGPLPFDATLTQQFVRIGQSVGMGLGLRGLFGIDAVVRDGTVFPVEVNPRYTASVEVLEFATGISAMAKHRAVFEATETVVQPSKPYDLVAKAIYFAPKPICFRGGRWPEQLLQKLPVNILPRYADIPQVESIIEGGTPVMTYLCRAQSIADGLEQLHRVAADLDHRLCDL
jgi:predicted ATP-grasp superfamily ATP-dependent carboligase